VRRSLVLFLLLLALCAVMHFKSETFFSPFNIRNLVRQMSLLGIFSLGVGFVIITGGIDLSVGSIIGLSGLAFVLLLTEAQCSVGLSIFLVLALGSGLGLLHGLLVSKLKIQPFIVTLCGLLIYRGIGRFITQDMTQGFGNDFPQLKFWVTGAFPEFALQDGTLIGVPLPFWILAGVGLLATLFLHKSIYGRHLYALGRNEDAARYSGIKIDRLKILAYVFSAGLASFAGMLYAVYTNTVQPANSGNTYELYAIAACVLGGCSLRGGEGTVLGIILGAAVIPFLRNFVSMYGLTDLLEYTIIGIVILITVTTDEILKARSQKRFAFKTLE